VTYEWRDHTAEVELVVRAPSPEEVFREAADALGRYVELDRGGEPAARVVELSGRDHPTLLVALLEELIYLADTDGFVADDAAVTLSETDLRVELTGRTTSVQPIVKAATYHDLQFQTTDGCWEARVILDV
jgi:SHS2 domain-containing protein